MEPLSSSSSGEARCNGKKRKIITPAAHENAKRLITVQECNIAPVFGRPPHSPRVSLPLDRLQQPVTVSELTELLHYAALGKTGGIKQPSWCRLLHQKRIKGLNVVIVEGLTQSHFYKHYLTLRHLRANYTTRVTLMPSFLDVASRIFSSEVPKSDALLLSQKQTGNVQLHRALRSHPVITKYGTQRRGPTAYVLTQEEMIKKHYPIKGMPGFEDFMCTNSVDSVTDSSPLYGLDCEMCLTVKGNELARVSLVDSDGNCVLDELVKPQNVILNYLTRFSGITAAMLRHVRTTLLDVQVKLRMLLPSDAVLVGHSINNDLMALKLIHPHVIDTSLLYRKEFGQRFKLKVLAEKVLKKQIQTDETKGHNPTEDAVAALELAQYFIRTGPLQVVELHLEELWGYVIEEESTDPAPVSPSQRFADILQMLSRQVSFIGRRSDIALNLCSQLWYNSDKEVLAAFRRQTHCPYLTVLQFSSFSDHLKRYPPHQQQQQQQRECAKLRDLCVVLAGPFSVVFAEADVRSLFGCCGPIRRIKMLHTTLRVHAEVEFELLEGAMLALTTLNGINVQGQHIKVQRPVYESMLDTDLTLEALMCDSLNSTSLYTVKVNPDMAERISCSERINGHTLNTESSAVTNRLLAANDTQFEPTTAQSNMSEETFTEKFAHFGMVKRVVLHARSGKHASHAHIKFKSSEEQKATLRSSKDLWKENYLVCPSLTPSHLASWVTMATPVTIVDPHVEEAENKERTHMFTTSQDYEMTLKMKKLNRRLRKLFKSLPDGTLSVVILPGHASAHGYIPGLCLMEVKQVQQ